MPTDRRPRVLQVVLSLHPGGTERLVLDLVTRLHADIPMRVCCLDDEGAWADECRRIGVEVRALGRRPGFHPQLGRQVAREAAAHQATLIHAHHYSPFVYSCIAKLWRPGTKLVYTEHGRVDDAPPSPRRRLANRLFARFPSHVFAVSDDLRRHLAAEGLSADVVYNGIDIGPLPTDADRTTVRAELGLDEDTILVGTIARLDPVKDLGSLIDAVAQLSPAHDVRLLVVGDGPERERLTARAQASAAADRIRFLGRRDDARRWLAGCDVYVNCSISEGVSLTILEAMAAGLPVVVTGVGGTPEVVTPDCGVLVPARDTAALARAIASLAADASRRRALGAAGRRRVESAFSLDRMVARYRDVYQGAA